MSINALDDIAVRAADPLELFRELQPKFRKVKLQPIQGQEWLFDSHSPQSEKFGLMLDTPEHYYGSDPCFWIRLRSAECPFTFSFDLANTASLRSQMVDATRATIMAQLLEGRTMYMDPVKADVEQYFARRREGRHIPTVPGAHIGLTFSYSGAAIPGFALPWQTFAHSWKFFFPFGSEERRAVARALQHQDHLAKRVPQRGDLAEEYDYPDRHG